MKILENIQTVGFDAFGTLIDDTKRPKFNLSKVFKKYGLSLKKTDLLKINYGYDPDKYFKNLFNYLFKLEGEGRTFKKNVSQFDKKIIFENYQSEIDSYSLRPQTEELLEKIKKEVDYIFLISNLSSVYVEKVEELLNGYDFLFKLYSCNVGHQKTIKNTDIFDLSSEMLNEKAGKIIHKEHILFTGDSNANDVIASKKAGMNSIDINEFEKLF